MHYIIALALLVATLFVPGPTEDERDNVVNVVPHAEFNFGDGGYYTTREGRHYHFDRDDDRWHWSRTHAEGRREEERRERVEHRR